MRASDIRFLAVTDVAVVDLREQDLRESRDLTPERPRDPLREGPQPGGCPPRGAGDGCVRAAKGGRGVLVPAREQ